MEQAEAPTRKTGRPLSFDREAALENAKLAFWASGYETTSLADLTAAMGITAPSLYAAFGNKEQLFLAAMRRYAGDPATLEQGMQNAPTARDGVAAMLRAAAVLYTGDTTPRGCLLASAAATGSPDAAPVRAAVAAERHRVRQVILRRIALDISRGHLAPDTPADALADLTLAVTQGMSVLARDGTDRAGLLALADAAMASWAPHEV